MQEGNHSKPELDVGAELLRERNVDVSGCTECGACSDVCPLAFAMDVSPADLVIRARKGAGTDLLSHAGPWVCTDCRRCSEACPVDIDVARVMEGLRLLAHRAGRAPAEDAIVRFHQLFWGEVAGRGRVHELSLLWNLRGAVPGWRKRLALVAVLLGKRKLSFGTAAVKGWPGPAALREESAAAPLQGGPR